MSAPANNAFQRPTAVERIFNGAWGALVGWGLGFRHSYLLEVRGRRSGRAYSAPVNVLEVAGNRFLVAPRGNTQWVRNARAAGSVVLRRGGSRRTHALRELADAEKPPLLAEYLQRFRRSVQGFFPVPAGSPADAFHDLAARYPVFELLNEGARRT